VVRKTVPMGAVWPPPVLAMMVAAPPGVFARLKTGIVSPSAETLTTSFPAVAFAVRVGAVKVTTVLLTGVPKPLSFEGEGEGCEGSADRHALRRPGSGGGSERAGEDQGRPDAACIEVRADERGVAVLAQHYCEAELARPRLAAAEQVDFLLAPRRASAGEDKGRPDVDVIESSRILSIHTCAYLKPSEKRRLPPLLPSLEGTER